jgi:anti-anti-sigma factor
MPQNEHVEPPAFDVTVAPRGGRIHVALVGGFDRWAASHVAAALQEERPFLLPITIDLSEVSFMDSAGLRCLRYADQWSAEDAVGRVRLVGVRDSIRHLFGVGEVAVRFDIA